MVETTIINNTFKVVSELLASDSELSLKGVPVVKYDFHYPVDAPVPVITGYIGARQQRDVQYSAPDAFRIKGQLMLTVKEKEVILNGNLYYGYNENPALQHHFDGTLALFRHLPPVPPPPPPDNDDDTNDLPPQTAIDAPLFPYINIQPWPDEAPANSWLHFFSYNPAHTGADSLYSQLVATTPQKDRKAMEQLCIQFLQNDAPFAGQYYGSLQQVPAPFNSFPDLYDEWVKMADYCEGDDDISAGMDTTSWLPIIDQLWQNYFALAIITGFNESFAVAVNKILLICNLLETQYSTQPARELSRADISRLLHATVVLPADIFPLPPYPTAVPLKDDSWIAPYAIGQLKMSRYRLLRYQPGEIAGIRNVMKGEQKKIMQRQLSSDQEKVSERSSENTSNISRYQQVSNDLLLEAKKTLAGFTQSTSYDNFTTTYGPPTQAVLNGKWSSTLKPDSDSIQSDSGFVSRILNSTLNRISESVSRTRSFSKYNEQESVTSSLFDNRHGDGHFRGIYRWLNKIYRVSVENYGHRFLLELSIAQPARDYIRSQQSLNATDLQKPLSPAEMGITTYTDITTANYAQLLSYYQVDIIRQPPEPYTYAAVILSPGETEKYAAIPDNYFAVQATVTGIIAGGAPVRSISGIAGSALFELTDSTRTQTLDMDGEKGQLPVSVIGPNTPDTPPYKPNDFTLNVRIKCSVTEEKMNEWKAQVYRQISEAWQKRISVYISTLSRLAGEGEQGNPELLRNTERSALQRRCAALLMQVFDAKVGDPATFQINEPRYYQFLREALEWDEMTWFFDDSPSVFSYALQGRDDSLRPFLQAQRARVLLPVRPSFNFQLLYYLSSGIIWPAPYPFVPVNSADTRIAAHLKSVYNDNDYTEIEHTWEISLPTAMQVVQESSELPEFTSQPHP
ncbi:hypothetical protein HF324_07115 [Chitinophaga oryzae]|uniref:Uncharacterized protein n=1 Tax=Chitinophaga oryzae TaxID=2725414 RepID=A0ABX6LC80_9BACT|nr:hypothetical protein [Chitinophaga oryzae]QJB37631.1 hypothetical protein HF324_07115 [Chitinophaga oryzae]